MTKCFFQARVGSFLSIKIIHEKLGWKVFDLRAVVAVTR